MNNWICVKERLPPDYHEVMYFAVANCDKSKEIMCGHRENGFWKHCCMFYQSQTLSNHVTVTHWMELPDHPILKTEIVDDLYCPNEEEAKTYGSKKAKEFIEKLMVDNELVFKRLSDK